MAARTRQHRNEPPRNPGLLSHPKTHNVVATANSVLYWTTQVLAMAVPLLCIMSIIKIVRKVCKLFKEKGKRIKRISLLKNANTLDMTQIIMRTVKFQLALSYTDRILLIIAWFSWGKFSIFMRQERAWNCKFFFTC